MTTSPLPRLRKLCLALPEAHEAVAHGEPTFRVRKKQFAMYASANTHHGHGQSAVWIKSTPDEQDFLIQARPEHLFKPPYVGHMGWIGVPLDGDVDWVELEGLLRHGYALVAPKRLLTQLGPVPAYR